MDERLRNRLTKWHDAVESLQRVESEFLLLEANEKPMFSALFLKSEGKTVVEREANAYANPEWALFQNGLVAAKVAYNKEKRLLEIKQSAFQASYLEAKSEAETIKKMPRALT